MEAHLNLSIHPSIHKSIHPSIHPSVHSSIWVDKQLSDKHSSVDIRSDDAIWSPKLKYRQESKEAIRQMVQCCWSSGAKSLYSQLCSSFSWVLHTCVSYNKVLVGASAAMLLSHWLVERNSLQSEVNQLSAKHQNVVQVCDYYIVRNMRINTCQLFSSRSKLLKQLTHVDRYI